MANEKTWLWLGNSTQYNPTPSTNLTAAEAAAVTGHTATASAGNLAFVEVGGETVHGAHQVSYNHANPSYPDLYPTLMDYTLPTSGIATIEVTITALISVQLTATVIIDGVTQTVSNLGGAMVQMSNGDIFFRPAPAAAPNVGSNYDIWETFDSVLAVTVNSGSVVSTSTAVNPVVGFDPPYFVGPLPDVPPPFVPCFVLGSMILTMQGEKLIEQLKVGDLVVTQDRGLQPIRWIGHRRIGAALLARSENLRPIRISAGALGGGLPRQDLMVSPHHRMLVHSTIAHRMFGEMEVLVAAKHMVDADGIEIEHETSGVDYFHLLFDRHEIVFANGAPSEAFYPGEQALSAAGEAARDEIFQLFPELRTSGVRPVPARQLIPGRLGRRMVCRHLNNRKSFIAA